MSYRITGKKLAGMIKVVSSGYGLQTCPICKEPPDCYESHIVGMVCCSNMQCKAGIEIGIHIVDGGLDKAKELWNKMSVDNEWKGNKMQASFQYKCRQCGKID